MTRKDIMDEIKRAAANGRLTCEKAHELAARLKIPLKDIGMLCNEMNIKITACQLGCF